MTVGEAIRTAVAVGPDSIRIAPGRVNLMGEHADHSLLPVLPMTIDRSIEIRASADGPSGIRLDSEQFPESAKRFTPSRAGGSSPSGAGGQVPVTMDLTASWR